MMMMLVGPILVSGYRSSRIYPTLQVLFSYLLALASFLSKGIGLSIFALFVVHDLVLPGLQGSGSSSGISYGSVVKGLIDRMRRPVVVFRVVLSVGMVVGK